MILRRSKPPGGSLAKAWVSAETAASEVGTWRETKPKPQAPEGWRLFPMGPDLLPLGRAC